MPLPHSMAEFTSKPLRIGYVPEHFSTPLYYAQKYFGLAAELVAFPSGTGHMIISLRSGLIDIGIGLTEGWVAGLGQDGQDGGYKLVGTYVETPLCWAISTGPSRHIESVLDLKNSKIGVSRIGSGSYVMGFVLADQQGWLSSPPSLPTSACSPSSSSPGNSKSPPFEVIPLQTFDKLRTAVNDHTADFFMWEHFTSKRYYDNGSIKRIGEIYTPWSSWKIVASTTTTKSSDSRLEDLFTKLDQGIKYFEENPEENVKYISTELDYSEADAREWLGTVKFSKATKGVDRSVIEGTIDILRKAGVLPLGEGTVKAEEMIDVQR